MYLLRRAALRSISSQPSSFVVKQRTFVTSSSASLRSVPQWSSSIHQRRWASGEASPTDAQTSGETVTTEPSEAEQKDIEEKSVSSPGATGGAQSSSQASNITETVKEKVQQVAQRATEAASSVADAAPEAFREPARRAIRGTGGPPPSSEFQQAQPGRIVYVGNLFFEVTAEQLEREFSKYGDVINSKIATDPKGLSKGFGYVEFDNVDSASAAIEHLDQTVFQGRRMAVQYHVRREPRIHSRTMSDNPPSKCLFIGNMSFQMSDKDLNDLFRDVRNVLDVRVAIDRRSGQPRGFAHADFVDVASATKAKEALESKTLYGRTLRVDYSAASSTTRTQRED